MISGGRRTRELGQTVRRPERGLAPSKGRVRSPGRTGDWDEPPVVRFIAPRLSALREVSSIESRRLENAADADAGADIGRRCGRPTRGAGGRRLAVACRRLGLAA